MSELQIKAESLPERCEVCHQTDCFDPVNNHCTRCAGVSVTVPSSLSNSGPYMEAINQARQLKSGGAIALLCLIANILFSGRIDSLTAISIILAIGMVAKGLNILRILRKVSTSDPDWMITRKRTISGIRISALAALTGIFWILICLLR
jgi:hypothetical protein